MDLFLKLLPVLEILGVAAAAVWSIQTWRSDRREQRRLEVTNDCLDAYSQLLGLIQDRRDKEARRKIFLASMTLDMKAHLLSPNLANVYRNTFRKIDETPASEDVDAGILEDLEREMADSVKDTELLTQL